MGRGHLRNKIIIIIIIIIIIVIFIIITEMKDLPLLLSVHYCKGYCHRVTTQLQSVIIIVTIIIIIIIIRHQRILNNLRRVQMRS